MTRPKPLATHVVEHFWAKVNKTDACWLWIASTDRRGYGQVRIGPRPGRLHYAHRLAYEMEVGPIPEGLVIDHLCRTPACGNPDHLEPVTQGENIRRGWMFRKSDTCGQGHPYVQRARQRTCVVCKAAYDARRYAAGTR